MNEIPEIRILLPGDAEAISLFQRQRLKETIADEMDREMASWTARWRPEALAHYLPQGWSFGAFAGGELRGYLLAQPLVFYRGLTQTLWVEDLAFADVGVARALVEVAHKWARDKHLQCVLLEDQTDLHFIWHEWKNVHRLAANLIEVRSAKF